MKNLLGTKLVQTIVFACLVLSFTEYVEAESEITGEDYQALCRIYENVTIKKMDLSSKESEIVENIQEQLPLLFNKLFQYVYTVKADRRYKLISQYAKQNNMVDWKCDAASQYYLKEFNSD